MVVNAADIPTSDKERVNKSNRIRFAQAGQAATDIGFDTD